MGPVVFLQAAQTAASAAIVLSAHVDRSGNCDFRTGAESAGMMVYQARNETVYLFIFRRLFPPLIDFIDVAAISIFKAILLLLIDPVTHRQQTAAYIQAVEYMFWCTRVNLYRRPCGYIGPIHHTLDPQRMRGRRLC